MNIKGAGEAKEISALAAQEPMAPTNSLMVLNHDENVVDVTWEYQSDMGSPLTGYKVFATNLRAGGGVYEEVACTSDEAVATSCKV